MTRISRSETAQAQRFAHDPVDEFDAVDHQIAEEMRAEWIKDGEEGEASDEIIRQAEAEELPLGVRMRAEINRAFDRALS